MGTQLKVIKIVAVTAFFGFTTPVADASKESQSARLSHAKELLGGTYKRSVVRHGEKVEDVTEFVEQMTKRFLPDAYGKKAKSVATAIIREAEKYEFDPIFLMAVIQNESSFNPEMRGGHGEIGLMQVKPSTAKWIGKLYGLKYKGDQSLLDPVSNIRFGAAFMDKLRDQFDSHSRLYISAYNIGATKVRRMVSEEKIPKEYVQAVMKRYVAIYSAFAHNGDVKARTELAVARLRDVTRTIASNEPAVEAKLSAVAPRNTKAVN